MAERIGTTVPTLFIGLGGTGSEVLLRLRRHILQASWGPASNRVRVDSLTEFPIAAFINFDTALWESPQSKTSGEPDAQGDHATFTEEERIGGPFNMQKYVADDEALARYPHIQSWFPFTPKRNRELGLSLESIGPNLLRALGRLYFFDKYQKVRDQIRLKLRTLKSGLSKGHQLERLGLDPAQDKIKIVVICSAVGGTGSGSFLDMGWLARWIARETVDYAEVELVLFMPSGFESAGKDRIEANGYAALMELETAMRGGAAGHYLTRWDAHDEPKLANKPYDDVYLVDSGNVAQQHTGDIKDIYQMVADALFEDFASADFAFTLRHIAVHQRRHKILPFTPPVTARYGDMKLTYCKGYSAFGHATLHVPEVALNSAVNDVEPASLLDVLEQLTPTERQNRFKSLLERAMPWIDANLAREFSPRSDQYRCRIGVAGAREFEKRFRAEIEACVPTQAGITSNQISIVETGISGRAVCYCELSGIPLTVLRGLEQWRKSYRKESERLPLHTHIDPTQFVHPLVPSMDELNALADDFKHYLLAVMTGVLVRLPQENVAVGLYQCMLRPGEVMRMGNERSFRKSGLPPARRDHIINRVNDRIEALGTTQLAALAVLAGYYEFSVYAPKVTFDEAGAELFQKGFAGTLAGEAARELTERALRSGLAEREFERLKDKALERLSVWASPIEGSDSDAYEWEVGEADAETGPRLKYVVRQEYFQRGADDVLAGALGLRSPPLVPPPLPTQYMLAINGQQEGPYTHSNVQQHLASGKVDPLTLVWRQGLSAWLPLGQVPEFAGPAPLLGGTAPSLPDPPL